MPLSIVVLSIALAMQTPAVGGGRVSPVVDGSTWTLVELPAHLLDGDRVPTLAFAGGKVQGSDGCNRYTAAYSSNADGTFRVTGTIAGTRMVCRGEGGQRAGAFRNALRGARRVRVDGERLELLDGKGTVLAAFAAQAQELAGTAWDVTAYNNGREAVVSAIIGTRLTLEFGSDGRVSGSAGCNRFTGTYTATDGALAIAGVAATRKMCAEPEKVMEQEAEFLQAITAGTRLRMEGARLELRSTDGALAISATRTESR